MKPSQDFPSSRAEGPSSPTRRRILKGASGTAVAAVLSQFAAVRRAVAEEAASQTPSGTGASLRRLYSLAPDVMYLNHASIGTIPRAVQSAHTKYLKTCENNPWLYMWSDAWVEPLAAVRGQCAELFGCSDDEITFSHNTTETFNVLAQGLPLGPGDEVLFSSLNHSGASVCWHHQAEARDFSVRRFDFPIDEVPDLTTERLLEIYNDAISEKTAVLVFPHVDNMVGVRHPMAALAQLAKRRGVRFVAVDGAQTAGMLPVRLDGTGVDVYATSAHKWLQAPKGLGVAYLQRDVQVALRPMWVTWGQRTWEGTVRVFEDYGTRNLAAVLALGDALTVRRFVDESARQAHHQALWQACQDRVDARTDLTWCSPRDWQLSAPLYAIGVQGDVRRLAKGLFERQGVVVRPFDSEGLNSLRCSPNVANSVDEIERWLTWIT